MAWEVRDNLSFCFLLLCLIIVNVKLIEQAVVILNIFNRFSLSLKKLYRVWIRFFGCLIAPVYSCIFPRMFFKALVELCLWINKLNTFWRSIFRQFRGHFFCHLRRWKWRERCVCVVRHRGLKLTLYCNLLWRLVLVTDPYMYINFWILCLLITHNYILIIYVQQFVQSVLQILVIHFFRVWFLRPSILQEIFHLLNLLLELEIIVALILARAIDLGFGPISLSDFFGLRNFLRPSFLELILLLYVRKLFIQEFIDVVFGRKPRVFDTFLSRDPWTPLKALICLNHNLALVVIR